MPLHGLDGSNRAVIAPNVAESVKLLLDAVARTPAEVEVAAAATAALAEVAATEVAKRAAEASASAAAKSRRLAQ